MTASQRCITVDMDTLLGVLLEHLSDVEGSPGVVAVQRIEEVARYDKIDLSQIAEYAWLDLRVSLIFTDTLSSWFRWLTNQYLFSMEHLDDLKDSLDEALRAVDHEEQEEDEWLAMYEELLASWVQSQAHAHPPGSLQRAGIASLLEPLVPQLLLALEELGPYRPPA
jgi:hypothetical protein